MRQDTCKHGHSLADAYRSFRGPYMIRNCRVCIRERAQPYKLSPLPRPGGPKPLARARLRLLRAAR